MSVNNLIYSNIDWLRGYFLMFIRKFLDVFKN